MNNNKGFINILVAVIIVVVIGVVGYFAITKKSEAPTGGEDTANWQTYKNDQYGFEFRYDPSLTYKNIDSLPSIKEAIEFSDSTNKSKFQVLISNTQEPISAAGFNNYLSLNTTCDNRHLSSAPSDKPEIDLITVNNIPILKTIVTKEDPRSKSYVVCYYLKNSAGKLISFNSDPVSQKNDLDLLMTNIESILQNLKFSEIQNNEIADWQTYRNDEYGFEFKYPENYTVDSSSNINEYPGQKIIGEFNGRPRDPILFRIEKNLLNFQKNYPDFVKSKIKTELGDDMYIYGTGDAGYSRVDFAILNKDRDYLVVFWISSNEDVIESDLQAIRKFNSQNEKIPTTLKFTN
jgi:hypothetical protein